MDYCHPCRRHLNGALACPGCGAPAAHLAVPAHAGGPETYGGTGHGHGYEEQPPVAEYDGRFLARVPTQRNAGDVDADSRFGGAEPDESQDADELTAPDEPQGRAARRKARATPAVTDTGTGAAPDVGRRDRKAAAHRRRRRRTVLIAAGFVLAAGGLSLAELGTDAPFSPFTSDTPDSSGDASVDGGASSAAPDRTASPGGATSAAPDATSGSPSASASTSSSPEDGTSPSASAKDSGTPHQSTPAGADPATTPAAPAGSAPATTPTQAPTTDAPPSSPGPSPTKSCDRFLWWCT
ncbi:hypothetical protein NX794_08875 [Streptomyces sp. LP11]|uniref:Uncharacterized protein n=1 Tax=Streptomyces pyxinicus TaxID=2970331 RepID=A0ABT2AYK3_9ACTN|nr:hypothetical protein [Streptomyces sp. LP11]MCS0601342.1 hypothetical protein [Streptomyces sp. LP11]